MIIHTQAGSDDLWDVHGHIHVISFMQGTGAVPGWLGKLLILPMVVLYAYYFVCKTYVTWVVHMVQPDVCSCEMHHLLGCRCDSAQCGDTAEGQCEYPESS